MWITTIKLVFYALFFTDSIFLPHFKIMCLIKVTFSSGKKKSFKEKIQDNFISGYELRANKKAERKKR